MFAPHHKLVSSASPIALLLAARGTCEQGGGSSMTATMTLLQRVRERRGYKLCSTSTFLPASLLVSLRTPYNPVRGTRGIHPLAFLTLALPNVRFRARSIFHFVVLVPTFDPFHDRHKLKCLRGIHRIQLSLYLLSDFSSSLVTSHGCIFNQQHWPHPSPRVHKSESLFLFDHV